MNSHTSRKFGVRLQAKKVAVVLVSKKIPRVRLQAKKIDLENSHMFKQ